jgi:hypothetical protein
VSAIAGLDPEKRREANRQSLILKLQRARASLADLLAEIDNVILILQRTKPEQRRKP